MDKESLILARELIIKLLDEQKEINKVDKLELMMNLTQFLDEEQYDDTIKVLRKNQNTKRR